MSRPLQNSKARTMLRRLNSTVRRIKTMENRMPNFAFRIMANIAMPIRNLFMSPQKMLDETEIKTGDQILDFGCGPGFFTIMAAEKTGSTGKVYALDIHPLALQMVEKKARQKEVNHIDTILSNCDTSIPDNTLDLVLLFDVFHLLDNQKEVLVELHRVLKPGAVLYFNDHHMKEEQILSILNESGLYNLENKGNMVYGFKKAK
jgi:ubiquinone/menaquinone biosynthesis C-methylase UbiE